MLAVLGSSYTISQLADEFDAWYKARQDAAGAQRIWQATVQNNSSAYIQQLHEHQYKQARQRQEDAKGAVSDAVNASGWPLAGAAVACGATALISTP